MNMNHEDDRAYRYLRLRMPSSIPSPDALWVRRLIQKALQENFGNTGANIYMDILWNEGQDVIIRLDSGNAQNVLAAVTMEGTMSLVKQSSFLPALTSVALDAGNGQIWVAQS